MIWSWVLNTIAFIVTSSIRQNMSHYSIDSDTIMRKLENIVRRMRINPKAVRYDDLVYVCQSYFGDPRQTGTSHRVYKTPWIGDPRVNIQNDHGKAKAYQVRQVLKAIDKLKEESIGEDYGHIR